MMVWEHPADRRRMVELVLLFPTLRNAACVGKYPGEFCATTFRRWARRHAYSRAQQHAVAFVLAVFWGGNRFKPCTGIDRFDVVDAMGTWDERHRAAFRAWAEAPWWP